jgi:isopentenyldiphosphate isomerase
LETELIKTFDEHGKVTGVATREDVHKIGHWHETFHCWFVSREEGIDYIYFQLRSKTKKDYPNLLDITAAGHILSHETIQDGIREVSEEVGIHVSFEELTPLGVIKYFVEREDLIDKELANVFLYNFQGSMNDFIPQMEEVSGILKTKFTSFCELFLGEKTEIKVEGFELGKSGERTTVDRFVTKANFVSHEDLYYREILGLIGERLKSVDSDWR